MLNLRAQSLPITYLYCGCTSAIYSWQYNAEDSDYGAKDDGKPRSECKYFQSAFVVVRRLQIIDGCQPSQNIALVPNMPVINIQNQLNQILAQLQQQGNQLNQQNNQLVQLNAQMAYLTTQVGVIQTS